MQTIHVDAASGSYDVTVGTGLLERVGPVCREQAGGTRALVVTDGNVAPLYGETVRSSLAAAGYGVTVRTVAAGEASKSMGELAACLEDMAEAGLTRDDAVVALGGGVVGDLAGFAASAYMRGCAYVQVPTSLLAMVDSSVGGKTAVDLAHGKNLAGAFYQPKAVLASVECLETVTPALFDDSCGEVIKYGVMCDPELFAELEADPIRCDALDRARAERVVARCVAIKRDVVDADERERGLRQTLNLGHTMGHAIESLSGYRLGHGSCVAAGMCMMARACERDGACAPGTAARIEAVCRAHGLPTGTDASADDLYEQSLLDKKRHGDTMNIVAIEGIGKVSVRKIPLAAYRRYLELGL